MEELKTLASPANALHDVFKSQPLEDKVVKALDEMEVPIYTDKTREGRKVLDLENLEQCPTYVGDVYH